MAALLDRVPDRMPQVELLPLPPVKLVRADHVALAFDAAGDDIFAVKVRSVFAQVGKELWVKQDRGLDDLCAAVAEGGCGQGVQCVGVAQHEGGLVERADQILACGEVDRRLAADGGVHHRQQRGRNLDQRDAAQIGRGGKAREVAHYAAAEGDGGIRAGELLCGENA